VSVPLTIVFRTYALVILNLFQDLKSFIKQSLRERSAHNSIIPFSNIFTLLSIACVSGTLTIAYFSVISQLA
jgi:hypothetical protein